MINFNQKSQGTERFILIVFFSNFAELVENCKKSWDQGDSSSSTSVQFIAHRPTFSLANAIVP